MTQKPALNLKKIKIKDQKIIASTLLTENLLSFIFYLSSSCNKMRKTNKISMATEVLKRSVKFKTLEWVDLIGKDEKTLIKLAEKYKFHELDIEDCLSENQRSKIDEYDDYLFIILHFPYYNPRKKTIEVEEIDMFVGKDFIVTIHEGKLGAITDLFESCQNIPAIRKERMGSGVGYLLYEVIDTNFSDLFPIVDKMDNKMNKLEKEVFESKKVKGDRLRDILMLKKDIITFRRVVSPQRAVIAQLEHKKKSFISHDLEVYFDDTVDKIEKIWNNLENMMELTMSIQDTNESLISHTTNNVIKILTIFSVIWLPLTFLTGLYGMNVALPLDKHPMAFLYMVILMAVVSVTMIVYFKVKKWM